MIGVNMIGIINYATVAAPLLARSGNGVILDTGSISGVGRTPAGRLGQPEEVAEVSHFLCWPAARFVNGVLLPVDGGYLCVG